MAHKTPTPPTPGLTGYHCIECMREGLRLSRKFAAAVEAGYMDERGYTRAERRALEKKLSRKV